MTPARGVIVTPRAADDIAEAYAWYRERSPRAADRWLAGVRETILGLGSLPAAHPVAPEWLHFDVEIRRAIYRHRTPWRIYFTIGDKTVDVLHVRHGSRAPWGST